MLMASLGTTMRLMAFHLGALGGLLLCACENSTAVPAGGSRYALRSIAGNALPAAYALNPAVTSRVFADTLVLREDGTGEWKAVIENSFGGSTFTGSAELTYTQRDATISISFVCPDLASCIAPPHLVGEVTSDGLDIQMSRVSRAPLVYERVR